MAKRIGLVGTGFIGSGIARVALAHHSDLTVSAIYTRRNPTEVVECPTPELLTNSLDHVLEHSDLIVECSGDPLLATVVVESAFNAGLPVVTMNSEFHVTCGSYFVGRGILTEGEGDQPGCLARLHREATQMGFEPLVYGNMKGFLNHNPAPEEMKRWAKHLGCRITQITSFTDGTKLQIEQALAGNGLGATITCQGMSGIGSTDTQQASAELCAMADSLGQPIVDYTLAPGSVPGVFLGARHDESEQVALRHFKLGEGPFYTLLRPYHLCYLELFTTIREVLDHGTVLLDNSAKPTLSVNSITKRPLPRGHIIDQAIGGFDVRGEVVTVSDSNDQVPIGILQGARLRHDVPGGYALTWQDVEIPDSRALDIVRGVFGLAPRTSMIC